MLDREQIGGTRGALNWENRDLKKYNEPAKQSVCAELKVTPAQGCNDSSNNYYKKKS